jgi:hypothetical protein
MELTHVDLTGAMFTTLKELSHLAEQQYGQLFVPTEVLSKSTLRMVVRAAPGGAGARGAARRARAPLAAYRVTRLEPRGDARDRASPSESPPSRARRREHGKRHRASDEILLPVLGVFPPVSVSV